MIFWVTSCNQISSTSDSNKTINSENSPNKTKTDKQKETSKRHPYKHISEIINGSYSTWVNLQRSDTSPSLALHFQYKDTLAVSYSPECWLIYPYKFDGNKIIVYWDNNIDTKYEFDIVRTINKTDKKYVGQPFMILELENDSTLSATYLIKDLIKKINGTSKQRTFFPDKYMIAQDGFL